MMLRWCTLALLLPAAASALDFAGLQAAVHKAVPGQVVDVPAGVYQGQLVVDRAIVLRGAPGARLVHEPGAKGPTLWIQAAGTRVEDLEVSGSGEGGARDHTAVLVTAPRVTLSRLSVRDAWSGVWADGAAEVKVVGLVYKGWSDYPFWERGEGVKVTKSSRVWLENLDLSAVSDGLSLENVSGARIADVRVSDARYAVHVMFSQDGTMDRVTTRKAVAGVMLMESRRWSVTDGDFSEGFRTGSAGIRQIRTEGVAVARNRITRQAAGAEMIDARGGRWTDNVLEENAVAWAWGGDNSGTLITATRHRGNLVDASGKPPEPEDESAHDHGPDAPVSAPAAPSADVPPRFEGNLWDAWKGWDLDGDGFGDSPYRFDRRANRVQDRPWLGVFLGSPWSVLSQSLGGGEVLDPRPLIR